ncbi:MAG: hypothetical protein ACE5R3_05425 [Nitrosopumilaceae archaeon]
MNKFIVGQRVAHKDGNIGIVENEYGDNDEITTDVRWLTPNNEPSVLTSLCLNEDLTLVGNNVVPMKKSREWWRKAREFQKALESIITESLKK